MNGSHSDKTVDTRLTIGLLQNTVPVVLYVLSANELAKWCDRLGLGPSDKDPMASKKSYVRDRLLSTPSSIFPAVAERVLHEFQSHADGNGKEPPTEEWLRAWEALRVAVGVDEIQTIVFARARPAYV